MVTGGRRYKVQPSFKPLYLKNTPIPKNLRNPVLYIHPG